MKYYIKQWNDLIINKDTLCNNIEDNKIIDIISYLNLPIESKNNPKKLVIIFITSNNKEVIHDIIVFKQWLDRSNDFVEPYTRMLIPSSVLQDIRSALETNILTIKNQALYGIKRGYEISKTYLLNDMIINANELYLLLYVHPQPRSRNGFVLYNHESSSTEITNDNILVKYNEYLNNNELETFDMFFENIKIKIVNNKLYFVIDADNIPEYVYNNLNYLIKHFINEIIIKHTNDICIDNFINKVKSWTNKRITFTKIPLI
jgi:hypothetical protein